MPMGWFALFGLMAGLGYLEVCCLVVDFKLAKRFIEKDLAEWKFSDFTRIYGE
jgi:hypothetical protein